MTDRHAGPEGPRLVGGMRCDEVLAVLPDYLDGDLPADRRASVERHLRGCDWCARFGGAYAGTVEALRTRLAEPMPGDRAHRLADALDRRLAAPPDEAGG